MTRTEIVDTLAKERRVEAIAEAMTRLKVADEPDLQDLCQMVYLILLEYDEDKLRDLWEHGEVNFLIIRLCHVNYHSAKSRYHYLIRVFRERSTDINDLLRHDTH